MNSVDRTLGEKASVVPVDYFKATNLAILKVFTSNRVCKFIVFEGLCS